CRYERIDRWCIRHASPYIGILHIRFNLHWSWREKQYRSKLSPLNVRPQVFEAPNDICQVIGLASCVRNGVDYIHRLVLEASPVSQAVTSDLTSGHPSLIPYRGGKKQYMTNPGDRTWRVW